MALDLLEAPFKRVDEFNVFQSALRYLHQKEPQFIAQVVTGLNENEQKFLKSHIETRRIQVSQKGIEKAVARRIVKAKRRGPQGSGIAE